MQKYFIVFAFIMTSQLHADNVYLKSGWVYINVNADTTGRFALIFTESRTDTVEKSDIEYILFKRYNPAVETRIGMATESDKKELSNKVKPQEQTPMKISGFSNGVFIFAAVLSAAICWDQFAMATDRSNAIDEANKVATALKIKADVSSLESARTRSYIVGSVALLSAIAFTVQAFEPITISIKSNKVNVAYNF